MKRKNATYDKAIEIAYVLYYHYVEEISFTDFEIKFLNENVNTARAWPLTGAEREEMNKKEKEENRAQNQAKVQMESITEMVQAMANAEGDEATEEAQRTIQENILSLEVRSDWHTPGGDRDGEVTEFSLLLCTGGPAVRITGDLDENHQPASVGLQYQDWGTYWTDYSLTDEEDNSLQAFCEQFYFGE